MFYGWGSNTKDFPLPGGQRLLCTYRYVSVLFVFTLAFGQMWMAPRSAAISAAPPESGPPGGPEGPASADPSDLVAVERADLEPLFFPDRPPNLGLWDRFSLVIPVVGIIALASWGAWSARDTTSVSALDPGNCFVQTSAVEIERLESPGCDEPHDSQIIGRVDLVAAPSDLPADLDPYWDSAFDACMDAGLDVIIRADELPEETFVHFFSPNETGWDNGERTVICYLHSPQGLRGSFIDAGTGPDA